ncbi:MAG TPA: zf-HC2 domain-containing protein [Steroidobacteraceae bacterium]
MNATSCSSEAARLLPWFVTGRLDAADSARVEAHVASCVTCREDLEHERALHGLLHRVERPAPLSASQGFQRVMARIDETERAMREPPPEASGRSPASPAREPRWIAAAVVVQALALALVGAALWRGADRSTDAPYRTLTSSPAAPTSDAARLRVVFAPGTTAQELASLLAAIDARIVDGPSPAGAYALALSGNAADEATVTASLARLRADARVLFAEPIRAEPAR